MKDRSDTKPAGFAHQSIQHESAHLHVTGRADYTDDLPEPAGTVHAALGLSKIAHGRISALDLGPVRAAPGVLAVLTAEDVPGSNDISPAGHGDDPIFAGPEVMFWGQPLFAVVAETRDLARRAAALARVDYEALPHFLDPIAARDGGMV